MRLLTSVSARTHFLLLLLVSLFAASCSKPIVAEPEAVTPASSRGFKLIRTFKKGETLRYTSSDEIQMSQHISTSPDEKGRESTIKISSDLDQSISKVAPDGNSADFTMKTSNLKMTIKPQNGPIPPAPKLTVRAAKINSLNQISEVKLLGGSSNQASEQMKQFMGGGLDVGPMGFSVVFPDHPVGAGSMWDSPLPKIPMFGAGSSLKAILLGDKQLDGVSRYDIKVTGSIPINMDLEKISGTVAGSKLTGTMDLEIEYYLDKSSCATVGSVGTAKVKIAVTRGLGANEQTLIMEETISSDIHLRM